MLFSLYLTKIYIIIYIVRESELVFVHIFDLQICFVGVYPTRQDLDDNVNSWVFIYHSLEITIINYCNFKGMVYKNPRINIVI